jgi:cytochrome c biogenesis protein CcmG/thiol:disulfide interchange protein DsbE
MAIITAGTKAPDFDLKGAAGDRVSLSAAKGKPAVITFLKSTCAYCDAEAPKLAKVFAKHKDDVALLGIASGRDSERDIAAFTKGHGLDMPWGMDPDRKVRGGYGATIVPTLVFVDAEGKVLKAYEGSTEGLSAAVDQMIASMTGGGAAPDYDEHGSG